MELVLATLASALAGFIDSIVGGGGLVLFEGVPEELVKVKGSFTAQYLKPELAGLIASQ